MFTQPMTWKCHVCGDVRPDAKISVLKTTWELAGHEGVPVKQNVRYCNDRIACAAGAPDVSFLPATAKRINADRRW